jgi:hypothetical protein
MADFFEMLVEFAVELLVGIVGEFLLADRGAGESTSIVHTE